MSVNFCTPQSMQTAPRADALLAGATPVQAQSCPGVAKCLTFARRVTITQNGELQTTPAAR